MNWQAVEAIGTIAGALPAAGTLIWGFRGVKSQMWLATLADFTKRCHSLTDFATTSTAPLRRGQDLTRFCHNSLPARR